jgi:NAD(P)-dependent dehydrogenase (short-subunit alcohol dehydrogenase family)
MTLEGQRVLFIGGSAGIGLAAAKACAESQAKIVIAGRSEEKLEAAKAAFGAPMETYQLDISREEEIRAFFEKFASFDHLVITGGVTSNGSCVALDSKLARESFDSKFFGQYFSVKYGAPKMRSGGSIVLFSGVLGLRPLVNTAVMSSVNGAINALARALALELAPIRVNAVAPGVAETDRISSMPEKDRQAFIEKMAKALPVGRIGKAEEIAQAVLFLLTNGYITGSTLCVDGGYTLH